jgi:riboflavin biosynthesis pyrimidine reductase
VTTFAAFAERRTREAAQAVVQPLVTVEEAPAFTALAGIGSAWTRRLYDGEFRLFDPPASRPAVSLVFIQSHDGNTGVANPAALGGGPTDKHFIYEGLSRVAADGVLAGAGTASGRETFFSVWHPELVALRAALCLPRHPAQLVLSRNGRLDLDRVLLFNVPDAPVFVLAGESCRGRCHRRFADRPWITVVPVGSGRPEELTAAFERLRRDHGMRRLSAVGGRTTASNLIDAGLVQDLCLTTAPRPGGEPNTPFYIGDRSPSLELIVRKREVGSDHPVVFEHWAIANAASKAAS